MYYKQPIWILVLSIMLLLIHCKPALDIPTAVETELSNINFKPDYNLHIRPILSDRCFLCHGTDAKSRKAQLDLSDRKSAIAPLPLNPSKKAIVPGNANASELVARILSADDAVKMPPIESHRSLSDQDKAILIKWIEDGAEYKPHWAFINASKPLIPKVKNQSWVNNEIDAFILQKLESLGWKPNKEADKETLIRRVSLDLTGLPPSVEEINNFVKDTSNQAYEKLVDRLLATKDYGENMAVYWMDLARFADTHGYTVDLYRPAWPWRDWVIKAFNENMPYDQFVTWQLAGDIFPNATKDQRLATAFNRIHAQNVEGGIVNEEFRVEYVMDRTNTFGTAFLGLTVECARCHDHKFDPFSQKNYYQLFSYFNNIEEAGQISWDNSTPVPAMLLTDEKEDSILQFVNKSIEIKENEKNKLISDHKIQFEDWKSKNAKSEKIDIQKGLTAYYSFDQFNSKGYINEKNRKEIAEYKEPKSVMGIKGKAFETNGDDVLSFANAGLYERTHPFSISAWLHIPEGLNQGVILYKGFGEMLYNYKGYFLNIRGNNFEFTMNHTWPYNSIIKVSEDTIQRNKWFHLVITYDGSSKANGVELYVNNIKSNLITEKDNLTKSILLINNGLPSKQPGLSFGADFRSAGIKGGAIDELRVYDHVISDPVIKTIYANDAMKNIDLSSADWQLYYYQKYLPEYFKTEIELEKMRAQQNACIDTLPEMMIMDEMDSLKPAYLLNRGVYTEQKERVYPSPPIQIFESKDTSKPNRLALANWLFDPQHPLTARVLVNRYWQKYFGKGLVASSDNFGYQGALPSHPALLDWLARYMIDHKWNIKAMQKYIVMSATYRQSSSMSNEIKNLDPENKWLSRGPSRSLTAEMMRDHALASSGLLSKKIGGKSVKPYQPDGVWALSGANYTRDTGEDLYRKSLYTYWMRTNHPPAMSIFDAPSRSFCTVKRQQTATPLQSLVLLNDPQLIETCRALSVKAINLYKNEKEMIAFIYRSLTCMNATDKEIEILYNLFKQEYSTMINTKTKSNGWLTLGDKKYKEDPAKLSAATIIANTVMNSDAYITVR